MANLEDIKYQIEICLQKAIEAEQKGYTNTANQFLKDAVKLEKQLTE
jgi:hypothetical protein